MELILRAKNLWKEFKRERDRISVVQGVNLDLHAGSMQAIMGSSGAGKSTLLHLLGTLEKPTRGDLFFGPKEIDLWKLSDEEISDFRNLSLGFVFQFHHLLPEFSALENMMMPAKIAGWSEEEARVRAQHLLERMDLKHRANHRPAELSGGEQQRIAIARAVMLRPRLLLGDELTGNLDSENTRRVLDILTDLNKTDGIAILLVTHDAEVASRMGKVLTMKDGKILNS